MSDGNIALVQGLYAAFGRGEIATIVAATAPDVTWEVVGRAKDHPAMGPRGQRRGVEEFFRIVAETQEVVSFTPREFYASGDHVFVLGHYIWTLRNSGKRVDTDWVHIFIIKDGKVTAFREFNDTAQFAEAYGG